MRRDSIQRRLIASVLLSQAILTAGLMVIGVVVTYWRLLSTLDTAMQAHATSVAVLVRYTEDASGHVYFDNSLLPESIDPNHPDQFMVWADRTGFLTRSEDWPEGLQFQPGPSQHWNFTWAGVPYHAVRMTHVPILDREEGKPFQPQTLTIVYASPTVRIRQQVKAARASIALASLLLLGATTWLASWRIRRGLLPLQTLARQAALVSTQSWKLQPPKEAEDIEELRPLTESMTQMLARLEVLLQAAAGICGQCRARIEDAGGGAEVDAAVVAAAPRSSEEYRAGLQASLQDLDRLEQLLQWMLRLARAEQWAQNARTARARRHRHQLHLRRSGGENSQSGPIPQHDHPSRDRRAGSLPRRPRRLATGVDEPAGECGPLQSRRIDRSKSRSPTMAKTRAMAFQDHGAWHCGRAICPASSTASIAETHLEPAPPAVLAWAWPS